MVQEPTLAKGADPEGPGGNFYSDQRARDPEQRAPAARSQRGGRREGRSERRTLQPHRGPLPGPARSVPPAGDAPAPLALLTPGLTSSRRHLARGPLGVSPSAQILPFAPGARTPDSARRTGRAPLTCGAPEPGALRPLPFLLFLRLLRLPPSSSSSVRRRSPRRSLALALIPGGGIRVLRATPLNAVPGHLRQGEGTGRCGGPGRGGPGLGLGLGRGRRREEEEFPPGKAGEALRAPAGSGDPVTPRA